MRSSGAAGAPDRQFLGSGTGTPPTAGSCSAAAARMRRSARAAVAATARARKPTRYGGAAPTAHLIIALSDQPIRVPSVRSHSESSDHRRPRLRLAIHPVDCAPPARTVGLRRDPAVRYAAGEDPARGPGRDHPVGRAEERLRSRARRTATPAVFDAGVPVLGICYGMQLMTHALGGEVAPAPHREFGLATIQIDAGRAAASRRCRTSCASGRATATSSRPRRRASPSPRRAPTRRSPRWRRPSAACTRCCSIRRSRTPTTASRSCATSRTTSAAAPATGR